MKRERRFAWFIALSAFVQYFPILPQLGRLPLQYYLKQQLRLGPTQVSAFFFAAGLVTYGKPLVGFIVDTVPFGGTRYRGWLYVAAAGGIASWAAFGALPHTYGGMLATMIAASGFAIIVATVNGALISINGRAGMPIGPLTALRHGIGSVSVLAAGPIGGLLVGRPLHEVALIAIACFVLMLVVTRTLHDEVAAVSAAPPRAVLRDALGSRDIWITVAMTLLLFVAPGFSGTPLFFHATENLGFHPADMARLSFGFGAGAVIGAAGYGLLSRRVALGRLVLIAMVGYIASAFVFFAFRSPWSGFAVAVIASLLGSGAAIAMAHVAARVAPPGAVAVAFALVTATLNIADQGSDLLGSWVYAHTSLDFHGMILVNAATSMLALPLLALLPPDVRRSGERGTIA